MTKMREIAAARGNLGYAAALNIGRFMRVSDRKTLRIVARRCRWESPPSATPS
jgi:hypothetical protein